MAENEAPVQHRLSAEGADPLALAGVNDANLTELGRLGGLRVVLRGDHLLLSGGLREVEHATPAAQHMIHLARTGVPFGVDDVARFLDSAHEALGAEGAYRWLAVTPVSFDISVLELFLPLLQGGTVVLTAHDDGRGADRLVLGNGLRGLSERLADLGGAATFATSGGFRVEARVPAS